MTPYYLSSIAEQDIEEVVTYIAEENPKAAHKFLDSLYDALNSLAENPALGHWRKDLTSQKVKFWTFKWHYLVIYKPTTPIEIVRVLSGYRDLANLV